MIKRGGRVGPASDWITDADFANHSPRVIFADLFEIHAAAFENAVVVAGEGGFDQRAGFNFEAADLFQDLLGARPTFLFLGGVWRRIPMRQNRHPERSRGIPMRTKNL